MTPKRLLKGVLRRILRSVRVLWFSFLSTNERISGKAICNQPVYSSGLGAILFGSDVKIGVSTSPGFWSTYCYLDSRGPKSHIIIGKNTSINNNFAAIAEKGAIAIGDNCLIGHDVVVIDSNFHSLDPLQRRGGKVSVGDVEIMNNVFIGSRVIILKNSKIGSGCVIAAGSVVSGIFPSNCMIAGNPAVIIRKL